MSRLNTEKFIERAKKIHGDKYIYDKVIYINSSKKVEVICPIHGSFWVTPNHHITSKSGCPACSGCVKRTNRQFIDEAKLVHGDKYDYSKVEYKNSRTKVCIICSNHGEFWQIPYDHLRGIGCQKCWFDRRAKEQTLSQEQFLERSYDKHGNKYDYSKVKYIKLDIPVIIICPLHGEFTQKPEVHLVGAGCPKCGRIKANNSNSYSQDEFIKKCSKIHNNKYDYSLVKYNRSFDIVTIICPEHGEFQQRASNHLMGQGCPKCGFKSQLFLFEKLTSIFKNECFSWEYRAKWLGKQRIDICIEKYKIAIEYDGQQHFYPINHFGGEDGFAKRVKYDALKEKLCEENGFKLFRIKYDYTDEDFYNLCVEIQKIIDNGKS